MQIFHCTLLYNIKIYFEHRDIFSEINNKRFITATIHSLFAID